MLRAVRCAGGGLEGSKELALQQPHQSLWVPLTLSQNSTYKLLMRSCNHFHNIICMIGCTKIVLRGCDLSCREHYNDGISLDPFEVMFVKVKAHMLDLGACT